MTRASERISSPLFFLEHMVVRLMLEFLWRNPGFDMRSQESHASELIRIQLEAHPNQVQMIGHEAIRRAEQALACGGVEHHSTKRPVKSLVQPALPPVRDRKRPVNQSVALVVFTRKARKIESAVEVWFIHGDATSYRESARESRAK